MNIGSVETNLGGTCDTAIVRGSGRLNKGLSQSGRIRIIEVQIASVEPVQIKQRGKT